MLVHEVGEGFFAAGDVFGQGDARVVAGLDDESLEQVRDGYPRVDLDEHPGSRCLPGLFADQDLVFQLDVAMPEFLENHVRGHDLGQAGRFQARVGIRLGEHPPAVHIDQQVTGRRDCGWRGHRGGRGAGEDEKEGEKR